MRKKAGRSYYQQQRDNVGEKPPEGWHDIAREVKNETASDNVNIVAAGIAFYAFLAIIPTLIAILSIYGLVIEPKTVERQIEGLAEILPAEAEELIGGQLTSIAGQTSTALSWGVGLSILAALWSANKGMRTLFQGINIAYNETESRGFFRANVLTLLFTLAAVVLTIFIAALVMALPAILRFSGIPGGLQILLGLVKWVLLAFTVLFGLAVLYRFAPNREDLRWRWVTWGTGIATGLWLLGSWGFSFYAAHFGSYNKVYGSLAAVIILMLWLLLSSFVILLGAEIDSTMQARS